MEWRESRDDVMVYHELWEGEWILATAWETPKGAGWVDVHGMVHAAPSLDDAKRSAEKLANVRIRVKAS